MPGTIPPSWRGIVGVGIPVLALAAGALVRFGIVQSLRNDEGFERNVRRWTPIATEFRMRQVGLARALLLTARNAERWHILPTSTLQTVEAQVLNLVRCESRPVYSSGRRGEWGDTGARWQVEHIA